MWMNAQTEDDTYLTYHAYWTVDMFQSVTPNVKTTSVKQWMAKPLSVPLTYRDTLLTQGRAKFLATYEEQNDYYRMVTGLPPIDTKEEDFIYLSTTLRNQLHASTEPVHKLSTLIQNNYMATEEYLQVLSDNPDKTYLKYLGMKKVDLYTARHARDFEIIRYPSNRSDINPNLLQQFAELYDNYREYVMVTLYNTQLESLYDNYRNFMGLIILTFVLLQISNAGVETIHNRNYIDDSILHIILSMYNIPSTLMLTTQVRRDLATSLLRLTKEKGTDEVYYDLVKILGYQDVIISKLMLMKGQEFDENGKALDTVKPYFIKLDIDDENPYETIASGNAPIYDYHQIIDVDPRWWDTTDTQELLANSSYTMSDSKYIMVEAMIHQMKYMFESIYFMRMILDNKDTTDTFTMEIPEIFGSETVSIYDLMVYILAATCMNNGLKGEIVSETDKLIATAGFNFDMDLDAFEEYLGQTKYVDTERVTNYLKNLTITDKSDLTRLYSDVMYPMREWLERKIAEATTREEYVEYENIYRAMFTYDINRNSFIEDFITPMEAIKQELGISDEDMLAFEHFYPRTISGNAIKHDEYAASRYRMPFISAENPVTWGIHIIIETPYGDDDRGWLYFHDILNSDDVRTLTNPNGTRIFMDYSDGEIGWEINQKAVNKAIEMLQVLDEYELINAYFQIDTPVLNSGGKTYSAGEKLPASIRTGAFRDILVKKVQMDCDGLADPPTTYLEYLYRKNSKLYNLLTEGNRFELDKDVWLNDVLNVASAVETELGIQLKYFEQSVAGDEMFFKPLITSINRFKSQEVDFAKADVQQIFGDKMDIGGNSNMFKLFDDVQFIIHFVTLAYTGYNSQFGLFDAEHSSTYHTTIKDRSQLLQMTVGSGFMAQKMTATMGSMHIVDEAKFFLNGTSLDPDGTTAHWICGEQGTGVDMEAVPADLEGWKDFVESSNEH
jgi:hypothetical protein